MNPTEVPERMRGKFDVDPHTGCWLWNRANFGARGYGAVTNLETGQTIGAHRMMWILLNGPVPHGLFVCHKCDVRLCCNPDHLFLGTHRDNTDDMLAKGRQSRGDKHRASLKTRARGDQSGSRKNPESLQWGEEHHAVKYSDSEVREAVQRIIFGEPAADVARSIGVTFSVVTGWMRGEVRGALSDHAISLMAQVGAMDTAMGRPCTASRRMAVALRRNARSADAAIKRAKARK